MNKKEFEILRYLDEAHGHQTQRMISEWTKISLGTVNSIVSRFADDGLINSDYQITEEGYRILEPYRVRNAIILAAGMSTRFIPVSYELPKGLISVKGEVLIEREIRQLQEAGVREIVVVVGYMMEKFFYLRSKYHVKLVVNNEFSTKNTHSSIYFARDYLSNTYILCSDNYYPKNMFHRYEYRAFYCSTFLPGISYSERAITFDRSGQIISTNKPSHDQWIMSGHAYFDQEFTDKYRILLEEYWGRPGIDNMYWENIWTENVEKIPLWVLQCESSDILEFDSMEDLKKFDPEYIYCNRIKVFDNICSTLNCQLSDIVDMIPIRNGLNNQSFKFRVRDRYFIYRHPGANAMGVVDRKKEATALRIAKELGIDNTLIYIDEDEGWKISEYVEVTEEFDFASERHIKLLTEKLKKLHGSKKSAGFRFDYRAEADKIIEILKHIDVLAYRRSLLERESMTPLFEYLEKDQWQVSLCHNDLYSPNLLLSGNRLELIDWEFAGDTDIGFDICKLFSVNQLSFENIPDWIQYYFGRKPTEKEIVHLIVCASIIYYYWYVWGIYANKNNQGVSDYLIAWYDKMNDYRDLAIRLMQ